MVASVGIDFWNAHDVELMQKGKTCELYLNEEGVEVGINFRNVDEVKEFATRLLADAVRMEG
jgi:hypothetical protein